AQAAYAGTDVVRFLNQLCARAYASIYRPRASRFESLQVFYRTTFPRLVRETLPSTKVSAALLLFGVVLGALTVAIHPDGARLLVPANLRQIISRGEIWTDSVLGPATPSEVAVRIFVNTVGVMIAAFGLGLTAALGTLFVILSNGVSVGAIVAACFQNGVGWNILTFMAAHGPVELSLICISGGAGLHLGRALVEPGERSRAVALRAHAQVAVQLILGCAPIMVAIGIVEGFVSPGPYFPWPLKLAVGAATGFGLWRWLLRGGA
ncbi:MAG TPA: stage II sporulation protein M, partial [Archangium sp.]